jgi:hypothetical protein
MSIIDAYDYMSGVDEVLDNLESLLRDGRADKVVELAEYAMEEIGRRSTTSTIPMVSWAARLRARAGAASGGVPRGAARAGRIGRAALRA